MRNRFRQKTTSLLLSALVLAWGIVPPGFQHAHAGGCEPTHRHGKCHEVAHHHPHGHGSDDGHHEHATEPDVSRLANDVLHRHWRLLGVEFSMPMPEEHVDGEGDVPPAVVRVIGEDGLTAQGGPSIGRALPAVTCMAGTDVTRGLEPVPRPPNLVTSSPLCDSARLERSGVRLV